MKFQCSWRMDLMCCPLQASFRLCRGSVKMRQSAKTIFLPILAISVSISTYSPILITLRNYVDSETEMVRMWVIRSMPIVVTTSIIVANAPPCTVSWMFFWWVPKLQWKAARRGLSSQRSSAVIRLPKSYPKPPTRCGLAQQSCSTSLAVNIAFINIQQTNQKRRV